MNNIFKITKEVWQNIPDVNDLSEVNLDLKPYVFKKGNYAFGTIDFQEPLKVIYKISEEVWRNTPWFGENFISFVLRDDITKEYHHFLYWDVKHNELKMVTSKQDLDNLIRFEGYFMVECV